MVAVTQAQPRQDIPEKPIALEPPLEEMKALPSGSAEYPDGEADHGEQETEGAGSAESGDVAEEAELVVHPFNTPIQVMGLCQRLKLYMHAEIIHVVKSIEGTVIRLSCRSDQGILEFLKGTDEVAEVWEEKISVDSRTELLSEFVDSEPVMEEGLAKMLCVALSPA